MYSKSTIKKPMPLFKIGRKFEHFKTQKDYMTDFKKVIFFQVSKA